MDGQNQLDEYNRIYHPSLKTMHQCVTNFSKQFDKKVDGAIEDENARQAYINRRKESENNRNIDIKSGPDANDSQTGIEPKGLEGINADQSSFVNPENDDLSDSEYTPMPAKFNFSLKYKHKTYRSTKKNCEPGLDVPLGLFKCTRLGKKCSGTIEAVKKLNGRVHIEERDAHSCE